MKLDDLDPFGVGALVRKNGVPTHYHYVYGGYAKGEWAELARMFDGQWARGKNPEPCRKIKPMEKGRWYSFAVTASGDLITCQIDGVTMFTWRDSRIPAGNVGVRACGGGACAFRNIRVTALDGTVLWSGLPDLQVK